MSTTRSFAEAAESVAKNDMKRRSTQKRLLIGLALAFGVMLFVAFMFLTSADQENKNSAWVVHTRDVLDKIDEMVNALSDAETGRRGYILSADERYRSHFTKQVEHTYRALGQLRDLTLDNPIQTQACESLAPLIRQRLAISTNSIQARQQSGLNTRAQTVFIEQGQQAMEKVRQLAAQMESRESLLLKQRLEVQDKNIKGTEGFAALLGLFGLGLFAALFFLFWRTDVRRRLAEEALDRTNLELEQRVHQRTAELSQSQERLAQEKTLLRNVIDNLPVHIYLEDVQGRFLVSNRAHAQAMNVGNEAQTLGKTVFDFLPKPTARLYQSMDQEALAAGAPLINRELEIENSAGQHIWLQTTRVPLRDSQGSINAILGISQDITERKLTEQALRKSEERFRALVTASSDVVYQMSPDWLEMRHLRGRDFIADTESPSKDWLQKYIQPKDQRGVLEAIRLAIATKSIFALEHQVLRVDGSLGWTFSRAVPLLNAHGEITEWFGAASDITERVESDQKLRTQLSRLDLLSRTTRAIGERQDLASIFQVVLQRLEDHLPIDFGCVCIYDPHAPRLSIANIGTKSLELAQDLAMAEHTVIQIDENGLSRCVHGELVYEPDVTQVDFPFPQRLARAGLGSLVIAPLLVESQVFGVLVAARRQRNSFTSGDCEFLRQLSEHVALAAHQAELYGALQQAYDDLRKTQQAVAQQERLRALGQMASGIAHDINNALSPVAIYSEFILEHEPNLSVKSRQHLQTISSAIEDVSQTVGRMREFYRQREPQLELAAVQLNEVVKQVLNLTRASWSDVPQQRGIVIQEQTELTSDLPVIMGVESEMREALTNLILNAVDAMPNGGTLILRTKVADGPNSNFGPGVKSVLVEVEDTGTGMDEETQRRCMEPFFTTKGERGTGLGLAMVYGMIRRHNADIEINSAIDKGTTVRLVFAVPTSPAKEIIRSQPPRIPPTRLRILVVDDDPMLLNSVSDALEADGHAVVTANGGQAGIDAFSARSKSAEAFNVVITDLGMPYIDGRKVAAAVKGICASTPVILLTGWGQRLIAQEGVPENVDRVLSKPPRIAQLRAALGLCFLPESPQ